MRSRLLRVGAVTSLLAFVLVFFIPALPFTQVVITPTCPAPGSGFSSCPAIPSGGKYSGYQSIGLALANWGAASSDWLGGYVPPLMSFGTGSGFTVLTAMGVIPFALLPIAAACLWLLRPELDRFARASRAAFGGFGLFLFIGANSILISMLRPAQFPLFPDLVGAFLGLNGILMILYAAHTWPIGLWERRELNS